ALICFKLGKPATVVLLAVALGAAAMEWFHNLRQVGYSPATLLGIAACAVAPIATYWRGAEAMPMVIFFSLVVGSLWYLLGVGSERPVPNLGVTMLGISYIGILGSYGALMLKEPNGIGMLLAAVIVTVAYDVGAFFVGTTVGRSPLSEASPNKTKEGLVGGGLLAIAAAVGVVGIGGITPFGDVPGGVMPEALALGLVAAVMAPLGDLFESLMKRDLGVKDMGSILPGHGGILDRFDALLFVLPSTYYLVRLFDIF
ncbi:MAG: phosphatidate cytidylyltransferase, partial [Acidimicrobiales bacterium]